MSVREKLKEKYRQWKGRRAAAKAEEQTRQTKIQVAYKEERMKQAEGLGREKARQEAQRSKRIIKKKYGPSERGRVNVAGGGFFGDIARGQPRRPARKTRRKARGKTAYKYVRVPVASKTRRRRRTRRSPRKRPARQSAPQGFNVMGY